MFEREKKKSIKVALGCVLASVALGAGADTVAWWPLAYEAGVKTTVDTVITNVANPDILAARPISLDGSVNILEGEDKSTYCPQGTNAFPAGWGVWVPRSNQFQTVETGLNFHKIGLKEPAGALRVDLTETNVLDLTTFTFEAFFRMQPDAMGDWNVIAVRPGRLYMADNETKVKNYDCWGVRVIDDNKIAFRFTKAGAWEVAATNNNIAAFNQTAEVTTETSLYDGRWHHVALVVDGEQVWGYVDYKYKESLPRGGKLEPRSYTNGADNLYIGSTPQTPGCFGGTIAHVRISDTALSAQQFLQFSSLAGTTNDVPLHVNFEPAETADVTSLPGDVPNLGGGGGLVSIYAQDSLPSVVPTNDVPAPVVFDAYCVEPGRTNTAVLANVPHMKDTIRRYVQWIPQCDVFTNKSFTVECFYKTTQDAQYIPLVRRREPVWNVQFNLGFSGSPGHVSAIVCTTKSRNNQARAQVVVTDEEATNDGQWHHAALVMDAPTKTLHLYRDHREVGEASAMKEENEFVTASDFPVCIGGVDDGNTFDGLIDDVRITMRALKPTEFLTGKKRGLCIILR